MFPFSPCGLYFNYITRRKKRKENRRKKNEEKICRSFAFIVAICYN